jgi:3(or 17)beta-hydroxysteroid dehydrogenase
MASASRPELGEMAEYRHLDVCATYAEWRVLVDDVVARHGKLDILVDNAGVVELGDIETQTEKDYRFIMAVSADGTWFGCQHAVRVMKETGGGSIVNMAPIASVQGESAVAADRAAKGAVEGLTRAVAVHCARQGYNIRCNSIHPAGILTPMVIEVGRQAALMRGAEEALNMRGRSPSWVSRTTSPQHRWRRSPRTKQVHQRRSDPRGLMRNQ